MPVDYDITYILPFIIVVLKFFENVYSLSIDISDFDISFQIYEPWYLKLNFSQICSYTRQVKMICLTSVVVMNIRITLNENLNFLWNKISM